MLPQVRLRSRVPSSRRSFVYTHRKERPIVRCSSTAVKICGLTRAEDARIAASEGAQFLGIILWPKAKRSVSINTARGIVDVAKEHGAEVVGVFVDEDAATIVNMCRETGVDYAQLHGDGARSSLPFLPPDLKVIYCMQCTADGTITTPTPANMAAQQGSEGGRSQVDYILLDGMQGGSGEVFDWKGLKAPMALSTRGWLLAGGLNPENVREAIVTAHPTAVDVSSGVCGPDGLQKDPTKVVSFIRAAKEAK